MNSKDLLLDQLATCYDRNGWFVAVKNAVEGVTAEQAAWKPAGAQHSIWELISHINHDNNTYLQRFQGIEYNSPAANNDETFISVNDSWAAELERFETIMTRWRELLKDAVDAKLDELAPPKNKASWATVIANMNTHNAYHGGQILLLRKLQGSWDPDHGVS
jgi:uncharacterized damage-inducible protein DinB